MNITMEMVLTRKLDLIASAKKLVEKMVNPNGKRKLTIDFHQSWFVASEGALYVSMTVRDDVNGVVLLLATPIYSSPYNDMFINGSDMFCSLNEVRK